MAVMICTLMVGTARFKAMMSECLARLFFGISSLLVEDWILSWLSEANITPVFGVVYGALMERHRLILQKVLSRIIAGWAALQRRGQICRHRLVIRYSELDLRNRM